MPDRERPLAGERPPKPLTRCYDRRRQALRRPLEPGLHSTAREGDPRDAGRVIEGMRKRRAIMVRMERVWNAVALGGVLGALLTTAGVVNLGNLPFWSAAGSTRTNAPLTAAA